ncbi:MAG: metallophosphoesterase [Bacillota bacterium]
MKIFAISDLHLSFRRPVDLPNWDDVAEYKPMAEVDRVWEQHARRIYDNWCSAVGMNDLVLVAGDISWAMNLEEAGPDLEFLGRLPGHIVAVKGNHDYWWQSISRVRAVLPSNVTLIQNDCFTVGNLSICGTRGWLCPNGALFQAEDLKIYQRELSRLENSLRLAGQGEVLAMTHYMPTNERHEYSGVIELMQKYNVSTAVYGHLHAGACRSRLPDQAWGINFFLTSADHLNFKPLLLRE